MEKSKVYFTDMRTGLNESLLQKLKRLMKTAGFSSMDFLEKFTAIKLHFGEPGNMAYLRPGYAKVVADYVKELGGKPFLTDCNTLYVGRRKDALLHLDAANENGFLPATTGCQVIIADGLKGTDDASVEIDGDFVKSARIGRAIYDADVFISLTHFKGHENTGIGGAIKNIGMGCGSRAGKMEMHNAGKPFVNSKLCKKCGFCISRCQFNALSLTENGAWIDEDKCVGCGRCIGNCRFDAIKTKWDEADDILNCKMAEYTKAVISGKSSFHISLIVDVSPSCDCASVNDAAIVPNIGMLASFDPVALDTACADLVNKAEAEKNTALSDKGIVNGDKFTHLHPNSNWRVMVEHGQKIGIGNMDYELVIMK
ncbi:MAG: DUF362 domain-containing protein [Clostridia bacterium]